jgi:hypothetical protein
MVRTSPRASYGATDDVTRRARAIRTRPAVATLTTTRSAPTHARTARKHGHLQATRGHTEVIVSIDPHGRLQAPATPPLMVWPLVRVSHAPDRRLAVSHLQALRRTRVVKEVAIVVATNVHDVGWKATRLAWLHPSFGGKDGVPHLRSLLKPAALPDRRHQPFIIASACAPAMRCHAAAGKNGRRRRPMRRRLRTEGLVGRPQSAALARWSGGSAPRAAREAASARWRSVPIAHCGRPRFSYLCGGHL